jgi:hypothetical protein
MLEQAYAPSKDAQASKGRGENRGVIRNLIGEEGALRRGPAGAI